ncbi:MAG: chromate efflux transporter [Chromatiales bacterium]|nr:chromate efflux transporter [Chromatiales bacterium]
MNSPHDSTSTESRAVSPIGFWQAFRLWLKLGFIGFGGPTAQIALMHRELVEQRHWISEKRFLHALNFCMLLPGPEAMQLATYLGWLMHRAWGGIIAGILFMLPGLCFVTTMSAIYVAFGATPVVAGLFYGLKPAITAIVIHATYRIGSRVLRNRVLWAIAALAFIAIFGLGLPFPIIITSAILIGVVGGRFMPAYFQMANAPLSASSSHPAALIDDDTPPPAHAALRIKAIARTVVIGLALWALPMALLIAYLDWQHIYTQMGWFFTKAALLTFGGAYAVLPYLYQGAIEHYGWLTPAQMIDGLALGEGNPGPLIMVVAFIGFVGAQAQAPFGPELAYTAGVAGALLVAWFTFLPSFVFILAGGPVVESTHGNLKVSAPLTAVTAAVVGVILNLAVFFAYHALWPAGFTGGFDVTAALITVAAAIALMRIGWGVLSVLMSAALLGLLLKTL